MGSERLKTISWRSAHAWRDGNNGFCLIIDDDITVKKESGLSFYTRKSRVCHRIVLGNLFVTSFYQSLLDFLLLDFPKSFPMSESACATSVS